MEHKETLTEFLRLKEYQPDKLSVLDDVVAQGLERRFNFEGGLFSSDEDFRRKIFSGVLYDSYFFKYFCSQFNRDLSNEEYREIQGNLETRINSARIEELQEVAEVIVDKVKEHIPQSYYDLAVKLYHRMMKYCERFSQAMHVISNRIMPLLISNRTLTIAEVETLIGKKDIAEINRNLPFEYYLGIRKKDLTISDINEMMSAFEEADKNRDRLHKEILAYGKRYFEKDYLDVFIDVMNKEGLRCDGYITFYAPEHKKGFMVLDIGIIDLPSGSGEFSRYYGQHDEDDENDPFFGRLIRNGYEELERAREEERKFQLGYKSVRYKSKINPQRTEEDDNRLLETVRSRFSDYVSFTGDYLYKNVHGCYRYIFRKVLEIDVNRIRANEGNPEGIIEEIRDFVQSLIPESKQEV